MSKVILNEIKTISGNPILFNSGSIIQVANTNSAGQTGDVSTTSSTYVSTGFGLNFTPLSEKTKLFVRCIFNGKFLSSPIAANGGAYALFRDGVGMNNTLYSSIAGNQLIYRSDAGGNNHHFPIDMIFYTESISKDTTNFTVYFNNLLGGATHFSRDWGTFSITIMEITQ